MMTPSLTRLLIALATLSAFAYTFAAFSIGGIESTISCVAQDACRRRPGWACLAGFTCGHIWGSCWRESPGVAAAFLLSFALGAYFWAVR